MKILFLLLLIIFVPDFVFAWGFETHVNIGLKILENVNFSLIKDYPIHFLLGNIFPDFFNLFKDISTFKKIYKHINGELFQNYLKMPKLNRKNLLLMDMQLIYLQIL